MDRQVKYTCTFKGQKFDDYIYVSEDCVDDDGEIEFSIFEDMKNDLDLQFWELVD